MGRKFIIICLLSVSVAAITAVSGRVYADDKGSTPDPLSSLKMKPGDEQGNDIRELKAELLITDSEKKAIAQIHKLLNRYRGTPLEPELQFRLAELYVRRAKTDRFLEMHRDSADVVRVVPKLVKSAASKKQIRKAIAVYDYIIKKFPDYEKLDLVIFNDAFANQQLANDDRAEQLYMTLVRDFQNSALMPDANLALGEINFQRHDFKAALKYFLEIKKYPDATVYAYGLYKAAWTYYNLRDSNSAIHELEDVIKYGVYVKKHNIDARLDLRREALFDLALFYEDSRPASGAYAYLAEQAGDIDVSPVIMRLAELYKTHGRDQDIITLLSDLIDKKPKSNLTPLAYVYIMNAADHLGKRDDVIDDLSQLDKICEPESGWSTAQKPGSVNSDTNLLAQQFGDDSADDGTATDQTSDSPKAGIATVVTAPQLCRRAFNKMALGFANQWLRRWNKQPKDTQYADYAEKAFAIYLKANPNSHESNRARFVYANVLFKRQKFRPASDQYAIVGAQTKDKAMGHDSRYFALASLQKAVNEKWSDTDEARFRQLAAQYLTKDPKGKFILDVRFELGFISYQKHHYDQAAPIFKELGQKYAKTDKGIKAQDLYMDILNIQKKYPTLRAYSLALRNSCKDKDRYAKLNTIYEQTYFLIVQGYEKSGKLKRAIKSYERFAAENPNSALAQKALFNAIDLDYKSGDVMAGAAAAVRYYDKYPNTKDGLDALLKAAQSYESMGQLKEAANVVEKLAKADPKSREKWMLLAADFYDLNGKTALARPIYEEMATSHSIDTANHALSALNQMTAHDENPRAHEKILHQIIALNHQPEASEARIYFIKKAFHAGDNKKAFKLAKELLKERKDGATPSALAQARLVQARILAQEFKNQSLKTHLNKVQMVLMMKTQKLSTAQIAYQSAARYGDPEVAVKAMRELGDCYLAYSDGLRNMPLPKGVPDNEAQAFRDQMEKLAIPMEEKGVEAKMQAYQTAKQYDVGDDLVAALQADLKKMNQPLPNDGSQFHFEPLSPILPRLVKKVGT